MDHNDLPIKLTEEPNTHLKCPVCLNLYSDPVINVRCGHTFCRKCAFATTKCPVDNTHCDTSQLVINRLVVGQIEDLLIHCQYGLKKNDGEWILDPNGCQEVIELGKRQEHEGSCGFADVSCPNSNLCRGIKKHNVENHLKNCQFVPCCNKDQGCTVVGRSSLVEEHSKVCSFSKSFVSNGLSLSRILDVEKENQSLKHQVTDLTDRVGTLESARDDISSQLSGCMENLQSLQQKYDELHATVESLLTSPGVRLSSSQMSLVDSTGAPRRRSVRSFASSPDNSGRVERWEMPFTFKCIGTCRGHKDVVWCLCAYKGKLYSAGADSVIKVWDLESLAKGCINNFHGHTGVVHCLVVSSDRLYSAGNDHSIRVWDIETGSQVQNLENAHDNLICAMVVFDKYICTSSFSLIKIWEANTLILKHSLSNLNHWVRALALSTDKQKLYSGSHNTINMWETENFTSVGNIEHSFGSVYSLAVTKLYIITGSYNQNIQLFDIKTHQHITNLQGHLGTVTSLIVSPSGNFFFSSSQDSQVQIWGVEKLLPVQTLQRHQASVNSLALFGNLLLSGSTDHEIKVFRYFQLP
ncbi:E3 ubiquitin-protein ligase TRAF7-like isoform X2 [Gigantopelta aegis]|uniref:E3 ubiquitin-protein ligase TRAF7-like isoform X2 n=1 Tax=Gigantopelta aegis TaxID=1735272 RepID=UPI001B888C8E|nr:E3 ubiquitin-protein ligase TRAF7-like isoform X2 [Gigantopelta aegis]